MDVLKKLEKDHGISKDDHERYSEEVQKATDGAHRRDRCVLAVKEKEILRSEAVDVRIARPT